MQPQLPQPTRQAQAHAPLQANAQPLPETKRKLLWLCPLFTVLAMHALLHLILSVSCAVFGTLPPGQHADAFFVDQILIAGCGLASCILPTLKWRFAWYCCYQQQRLPVWVIALVCSVTVYAAMAHVASVPSSLKSLSTYIINNAPESVTCNFAEKSMSKLKQRLGLKKQGSKTLTATDSSPSPSNLYPMAAGGHHPGNPHIQGQPPNHDPAAAHPGQRSLPHGPAYPGSGDLQEGHLGMAGQGSGRLLMQGSSGTQEAEEQAMMELAIKVGLCSVCVHDALHIATLER